MKEDQKAANDEWTDSNDSYYSVERSEIERLLPDSASLVMDIGCGTGATGKWIKQHLNAKVIGVERDYHAAKIACSELEKVYQLDIEEEDYYIKDHEGTVDVLLLLDVLEHLTDPWGHLRQFSRLLSNNGIVIASIPNVRNLKVLLPLIFRGSWQYSSSGILDKTHLRFFTKGSAISLFEENAFEIEQIISTGPVDRHLVKSKLGLALYISNIIFFGRLKDFITHQYVLRAKKLAD